MINLVDVKRKISEVLKGGDILFVIPLLKSILAASLIGWENAEALSVNRILDYWSMISERLFARSALINRIKDLSPSIITLAGGSSCREEMAEGIGSLSKSIDYIFSNESESSFSQFLIDLKENRLPENRIIKGDSMGDLDRIPLPDYDCYFQQMPHFLGEDKPFITKYRKETEMSRRGGKYVIYDIRDNRKFKSYTMQESRLRK